MQLIYCPQSFSGGGLYLKVKWLLWNVCWVTMGRVMGYYRTYAVFMMGYYDCVLRVTIMCVLRVTIMCV